MFISSSEAATSTKYQFVQTATVWSGHRISPGDLKTQQNSLVCEALECLNDLGHQEALRQHHASQPVHFTLGKA